MNKERKASKRIARLAVGLLACVVIAAQAAEVIKPDIGEPLRDAAVCKGPDGTYYLTGTRAFIKDGKPDFMDNDGIKLWSSRDMMNWKDEGIVWDMQRKEFWNLGRMNRRLYSMPERPFGTQLQVQGATTPRLTFIDGQAFVAYSICGHDVRLWRSAKDVAGPYAVHWEPRVEGRRGEAASWFNRGPGHGSLFRDRDGSLYLVWGPGYIQRFNNEATRPEGLPDQLLAQVAGYPDADWCAEQFDPRGASVFLKDGKYYLTWAACTDQAGFKRDDSFVAIADRLDGPYSEPQLLVAGSGPVVLFDAGEKGLMASCSIGDAPALVPAKFEGGMLVALAQPELPAVAKAPKADKPAMFDYAAAKPTGQWFEKNERTGRTRLTPLFDLPIADVSIVKGGDDAWYLTGSVASQKQYPSHKSHESPPSDFQNNDGIYLWRSEDMATWLPLGKVWDIERDGSAWAKQYRIPGNNPLRDDFCRGATSPEIHYIQDTYWIPYSMNGRGTGLLKSKTGKAEGPYQDLGRVTGIGESPNLFVDEAGGKTLWLWGRPLSMSPIDLENGKLAGAVTALEPRFGRSPHHGQSDGVDIWEPTGPFLFKATSPKNKTTRYFLTFSGITQSYGRANRDTLIAPFDDLAQMAENPIVFARHGGQTSVFTDAAGQNLFAAFSGADPHAVFRHRPGLYPVGYHLHDRDLPRKTAHGYYTRAGGRDDWDDALGDFKPRVTWVRDPDISDRMPDGYFYFMCSPPGGNPNQPPTRWWVYEGVQLFRSRDLKTWERIEPSPYPFERAKQEYRAYMKTRGLDIKQQDEEQWLRPDGKWWAWTGVVRYMKGNYWILINGTATQDSFLLRSESGKAEGPYSLHGMMNLQPPGDMILVEDRLYATTGCSSFRRFSEDWTAADTDWKGFRPDRGRGNQAIDTGRANAACDCGFRFMKIGDKFVLQSIQSAGDYGGQLFYSDTFDGEYKPFIGFLPDLGFGKIFHDGRGQWYGMFDPCHGFINFGDPIGGDPDFIQPIHLDMASDPPRVFMSYEIDRIGESIYEK